MPIKKPLLTCLLALTLALVPACTSNNAKNYMVNRGGDLVDILRFHVMAGKGIAAEVEATRLLSLGGRYYWAKCWGLHDRELGVWSEDIEAWGLLLGYHDEVEIWDIDRVSGSYGWTFFQEGGSGFEVADPGNPLDFLTFRGTLFLFLGADLEVRVGEAVDFICGIFQFDPAGDDGDYADAYGD